MTRLDLDALEKCIREIEAEGLGKKKKKRGKPKPARRVAGSCWRK